MNMNVFWALMVAVLLTGAAGVHRPALAGPGPGISELTRLAAQGDPDAMADLGQAYYDGRLVLKDPFKAKCWNPARQNGCSVIRTTTGPRIGPKGCGINWRCGSIPESAPGKFRQPQARQQGMGLWSL